MKFWLVWKTVAFLAGIIILLIIYATKIEPYWIEVRNQPVYISGLPQAIDGFRIVQLSDLHGKTFGNKEIVRRVNELHSDLIVITGDVFDQSTGTSLDYADTVLGGLAAKYGIYFVFGNNDSYLGKQRVIERLAAINIKTLVNERVCVKLNNSTIDLVGVDDPYSQNANLPRALAGAGPEPKILLAHTPEIIYEALKYKVDLTLVGHTHGGQITIPLMPRLITNVGPGYERYISGLYKVGNIQMYVNRGLGENDINMRFLTRPEITVITLHKKKEPS